LKGWKKEQGLRINEHRFLENDHFSGGSILRVTGGSDTRFQSLVTSAFLE